MNKKIFKLELIGFVFVSVLGTLGHFIFEWSGYNRIIGMVFPVNESTWEHLKLLFFPYLIWTVIQYILMKEKSGVIFSKAIGAITGMTAIVSFYYTYTGIIGKSVDWLNILSFFIGVLTAFVFDYIMMRSEKFTSVFYDCVGTGIFIAFIILFFLFTTAPPFIPLFKDPINFSYGI
ncbi:MAG: DUF6512 family protein [Eubacteriales bacterium]|nr:DUF6512 family protein [Eubacteriales bacterium]